MPRIVGIDLHELDLPFRHAFRHAAAERDRSASLFVRCMTEELKNRGLVAGEELPGERVQSDEELRQFVRAVERLAN